MDSGLWKGAAERDEECDSSDDTGSDAEVDETTTLEIANIEQKLSENPYHYQSHVDLITLLRKLGELQQLRNARTRMAKLFPLTQTLWMEWIEDEKKIAESEQEHDHIVKLLELAVKDYMCPDIWLEYSQYATRWMDKPDGVKKIRDVLERAVAAAGHHVVEGSCVWDMYREFENVMLLSMQPSTGSDLTAEQSQKIKKQREKITGLFRGQLSIPLNGMESTYQEYASWCEEDVDSSIKHSYSHALKKLKELTPFEDALLTAEHPKLQEYQKYIDHEIKSGTSSSVQCIFERALADNCLNAELWLQYSKYMGEQSCHSKMLVDINLRSVRNCPWIGQLWLLYLQALERDKSPKEKLDEVFDEALKAGFSTAYEYTQLWLTRCTQIRRMVSAGACSQDELSKAFEAATKNLNETIVPYYKESGDPDFTLWAFWSYCEAGVSGNLERAEDIFKSLTQSNADARRNLRVWREYFDIVWMFGGEDKIDKCRRILRQAVQNCAILPDPVTGGVPDAEVACQLLTSFERRHGTISDMDESIKKINTKLSRMAKHREKEAASYVDNTTQKKNSKQKRQQTNKKDSQRKRKLSGDKVQHSSFNPPKQQKTSDNQTTNNDGFKAPAALPIRYVSKSARQAAQSSETPSDKSVSAGTCSTQELPRTGPPPGFKGQTLQPTASLTSDENNNDGAKMETASTALADKRSIFISNLDFKLENVEEKLKDIFCSCGSITDVRLVKNNKGQFRGFCYIQFDDEGAAQKALALDRKDLEGRPIFVSPNVDKKKQPNFKVFKYDLGLEKHKLFVSNLSYHTTEDTLRQRFSEHGPLKGVRIVTNRKGQSKGLAYIEYQKESDAAQAVMRMDGSNIDDFAVKVAISNPPSRKASQDKMKLQTPRAEQFKGSRGRGRTQLSMMVPRSVARTEPDTGKSDTSLKKAAAKGMTNEDFANLLKR